MIFIARELREIMARLGIRSVAELVGRIDLVRQNLKTITSNCLALTLNAYCSTHTSMHL